MKNAKSRNKGYTAISGAVGHSGLQWEATRSLICSLTGPNRHQYVQENITWQHDLGPRAWGLVFKVGTKFKLHFWGQRIHKRHYKIVVQKVIHCTRPLLGCIAPRLLSWVTSNISKDVVKKGIKKDEIIQDFKS